MPARCLYEILGLESMDVEEEAIKKAYKRQALLWHPGEQSGSTFLSKKLKRVSKFRSPALHTTPARHRRQKLTP
eukprot:1138530-Pelagomonas_calceolata.AAC.5